MRPMEARSSAIWRGRSTGCRGSSAGFVSYGSIAYPSPLPFGDYPMAEKAPSRKRSTSAAVAKQQMLESLAETTRAVQERREAESRPEERIERRIVEQAVAAADALSTEGIVKSIGELRSAVGKTLAQLSDRLEEEVAKYVQIQRAI